jgi:hypothetical protein
MAGDKAARAADKMKDVLLMNKVVMAIAPSLALQGCAGSYRDAPIHPPSQYGDRADTGYDYGRRGGGKRAPHAGQWVVAVIGTPVYLAMKTVVRSASLVVAAPTAAVIAISDSPYAMGVNKLGDGLAANCGPPYALSPG